MDTAGLEYGRGDWTVIDAESRKPGEQTGLDTLVVPAVNYVH